MDPVTEAERRIIKQARDITLASVAAYLRGEAAKYSDPSEMDYRHGIMHAVGVINRIISGELKASVT